MKTYTKSARSIALAATIISLSFASVARAQNEVDSAAILPYNAGVPDLSTYFAANGFNGAPNWFNMPLVVGDVNGNGLLELNDVSVYGEVVDLALYQPVASTSLALGSEYVTDANGQLAALPGFTFFADAALTTPYANENVLVTGIDSSCDDALTKTVTVNVPDGWRYHCSVNFTFTDSNGNKTTNSISNYEYQNATGDSQIAEHTFGPTTENCNNLEEFSNMKPIPEPSTMAVMLLAFGLGVVLQLRKKVQVG